MPPLPQLLAPLEVEGGVGEPGLPGRAVDRDALHLCGLILQIETAGQQRPNIRHTLHHGISIINPGREMTKAGAQLVSIF